MSNKYFGEDTEQWLWSSFTNTKGFPVSNNLLDWVIGQDRVLEEVKLCLDEWKYKLTYLQKQKWYKSWLDPLTEKPILNKILTPGPYLLLLGDPGTGKSLIGKAMAEYLTQVYKKHKIKLFDVLCWRNRILSGNPKISIHPAGYGKEITMVKQKSEVKKSIFSRWAFGLLIGTMIGFGLLIIGFLGFHLINNWINPLPNLMYNSYGFGVIVEDIEAAIKEGMITLHQYWANKGGFIGYIFNGLVTNAQLLYLGIGSLSMGAMIYIFKRFLGNMGNKNGVNIGGASRSEAPKLLIDNTNKTANFIDSTGHGSSQLFGSIAWDPYQTGGLGTPEHMRVTAGDVHRANMGILYIDEIKNLHQQEAIALLSAMEDGCLPVTMRSMFHGADTSAMAVSTEPIPCLFFLLGAGNFDSISQIHPALMDRLIGYGRVVRMNNEMDNTVENKRKYVQFISQEISRFHLPPFSREACIELIEEGRRRSNRRDALITKFRPLISIIKVSGTLAQNKGKDIIDVEEVKEAIEKHCKTIQKQILEHQIEQQGKLLEIEPKGNKLGTIYGLAVVADSVSGEQTGTILRVKAQMIKKRKKDLTGYYKVTGMVKDGKMIENSIEKVRSVILTKYGVDIAQEYFTHIDFSQAYGVDGPSAGVTMTILLCSLIEGKLIRQDVAVTGEINISSEDEMEITAVGGLYEKIKSAEAWGFKKVVIPEKNYKHSIKESDYKIEVIGARNLDEYLKEVLVNA